MWEWSCLMSYTVLLLIFYYIFPPVGLIFSSFKEKVLFIIGCAGSLLSLMAFFTCSMRHCHCGGFSCFRVYCVFKMPCSSRAALLQLTCTLGILWKCRFWFSRSKVDQESPLQTGSQVVRVMLDLWWSGTARLCRMLLLKLHALKITFWWWEGTLLLQAFSVIWTLLWRRISFATWFPYYWNIKKNPISLL